MIRVALGASILGFGLFRSGTLFTAGLYPLVTGLMRYCPIKKAINEARPGQPSEMNKPAVDATDDSGGYRTGNPVTGDAGVNTMAI